MKTFSVMQIVNWWKPSCVSSCSFPTTGAEGEKVTIIIIIISVWSKLSMWCSSSFWPECSCVSAWATLERWWRGWGGREQVVHGWIESPSWLLITWWRSSSANKWHERNNRLLWFMSHLVYQSWSYSSVTNQQTIFQHRFHWTMLSYGRTYEQHATIKDISCVISHIWCLSFNTEVRWLLSCDHWCLCSDTSPKK